MYRDSNASIHGALERLQGELAEARAIGTGTHRRARVWAMLAVGSCLAAVALAVLAFDAGGKVQREASWNDAVLRQLTALRGQQQVCEADRAELKERQASLVRQVAERDALVNEYLALWDYCATRTVPNPKWEDSIGEFGTPDDRSSFAAICSAAKKVCGSGR
jgi:hypothetical protein